MSRTATATVFYGFPIATDQDSEDQDSYEESYVMSYGVVYPDDSAPDQEWDECYLKKTKLLGDSPCRVHCFGYDASNACVQVKASICSTDEDCVDLPRLVTNPEWDDQLKDFCQRARIDFKTPGWQLASLYW